MPPAVTKLAEQIDSRVLRERALIFFTLLALIFVVWNFLFQAQIDRERLNLKTEADKLSAEKTAAETQITSLTLALASDPAIAKKNEIDKLQRDIADVEESLAGLSQGLISANQLPKVLEEVLLRTASVKLLQVRTLAATELQLTTLNGALPLSTGSSLAKGSSAGAAVQQIGAGVYKHGVLIRVAGGYQQLIQLMGELEALPWKFYWESLDYTVTQYPEAEIDIRVFTLSSEEGQFGV